MTEASEAGQPERVDALWLVTLQRICGKAAHELKGALNAVSLNLEVVRSRSGKPALEASALGPFAEAAVGQLDAVIAMSEALLALTRSATAVDVTAEVKRIEALLGPAARSGHGMVELDATLSGLGTTSASSSSARLAIGWAMLAAIEQSKSVRCLSSGNDDVPSLRIEAPDARFDHFSKEDVVVEELTAAGIVVRAEPSAIVIDFPR